MMADQTPKRRLAAVLAADVAGYTRLMERDTDGTVAAWQAARDGVIDPAVAAHSGRLVKFTGDGFLAEFPSVQDAVGCALAIQADLAGNPLDFRMGINLGDIVDDGRDIHGEGVNVAARLESLAPPGGICISGEVHTMVRNRIDYPFRDLGEHAVKHVTHPVRVIEIGPASSGKSGVITSPAPATRTKPSPGARPSIAILPFENMSGDAEQEYFSDGIAEDIITDLSKVSALMVIARNSSFTFKGRAVDVKEAAGKLGVRYVLEGSVRKAGNRVRITAQLIDGADGGHLWAERYDRDLEDIFAVQDEVTRNIVEALKVRLTDDESKRIGIAGTQSLAAYDYVLRGRELVYRYTPEAVAEAERLFEKAIELDTAFSAAYSNLSWALFVHYTSGWDGAGKDMLDRGFRMAQKAVELAPNDPLARRTLSLGYTWNGDLDRAIAEMDSAIVLDPNFADAYSGRGYILSYAGRAEEAIESLDRAIRLNPLYPNIWLHFLAHARFMLGDYGAAAELLERRVRLHPGTDISRVLLAACYGHLGRRGDARRAWAEVLEINPDFSIEQKARVLPYKRPGDWDRFVDGLAKADIDQAAELARRRG